MSITQVGDPTPTFLGLTAATVRQAMTTGRCQDLAVAVAAELRCDSRVDAERIRVSAEEAVITLQGVVRTYSQKCHAGRIACEIRGVSGVKNELEVRLAIGSYRTDEGLKGLTIGIIQNHSALSDPLPRVTVCDGWLTIEGVVTMEAQKRAAEDALRDLTGVRGIANHVEVAPPLGNADGAETFRIAIQSRGRLAVQELKVEVAGGTIAIYGEVASCAERDALIELASSRRGISRVEDHVVVQPSATYRTARS